MMLHLFPKGTDLTLPDRFTYPFCYTPHPLCVLAAGEVQAYLAGREAWQEELAQGKMFGVLVVETPQGEVGYIAAFSGILAGSNRHDHFVPPVFDLLRPDGFFKAGEARISDINRRIGQLETAPDYREARLSAEALRREADDALRTAKAAMKAAKEARDARRRTAALTPEEEAALIRESQFLKADCKRLERSWKERIDRADARLHAFEEEINALKEERKRRSAALQQELFANFRLLNARGESKDLCEIFAATVHKTPPAGAGECAAPKLLQYAYLQGWKPKAMAEFWWGASPKTEVRHHGCYYPACQGKCGPILGHMLQGLQVDDNPLPDRMKTATGKLETVYEDRWLTVVNKPAGMLSVPGKEEAPSVCSLMRQRYPEADGPLLVHRLDMATSGLLLVAKSKAVHQHLQAQFKHHTIQKRYTALLEGIIPSKEGRISLPLTLNPLDRPRQVVSHEHGKPAVTDYRVIGLENGHTRIHFFPLTGRTHQLRLHAAHAEGLHCPIWGDELYGHKATRLYLHADMLTFTHPVTGSRLCITCPSPF